MPLDGKGEDMSLKERIEEDLKKGMKEKNESAVRALRMLKTAIRHAEVEKGAPLSDEDVVVLIRKLIRQRKESISAFESGRREDLAEKEREEIKVLETYAPPEMSDEEIEKFLKNIIESLKASSTSDIGKVMKTAMRELKGRTEGGRIREIAEKLLSKKE